MAQEALRIGIAVACLVGCGAARTQDRADASPGDAAAFDASTVPDDGLAKDDSGGFGLESSIDGSGNPCVNLQCKQQLCPAGGKTTLTGTVWNPAKTDPLYNVVVYVPNATVAPFAEGVSCERCGTVSGSPIAATLSRADGTFVLENVPVGEDIPLVIQIGRWRRQVVVPKVEPCVATALPGDLTRLPKTSLEGEIPLTAIVTSKFDPTECILRKMGVDDSEFTAPNGGGRVHLYKGNGQFLATEMPAGDALWGSLERLKTYDLVAVPCSSVSSDATHKQNVVAYADAGGRVLATDLSHPWVDGSAPAPWSGMANWNPGEIANPFTLETKFPKGQAMAEWLENIGATPVYGQIVLDAAYAHVGTVNPPAQAWVSGTATVQHFSFNTPVGAEEAAQCGRVVYSSFHVASGGGTVEFPGGCSPKALTAQEKILEFMLLDLASCIQTDRDPPAPPPIK